MRPFLYAFAALFLVSTPAHAGDFECAWRQLPDNVRSALTDTPQTIQDVAAAMESGIITEENLLPAMAACGVVEGEARTLGQYIAARALLEIQSRRLTSQFGLREEQLAALASAVSDDD